jgi:hypothetical protein
MATVTVSLVGDDEGVVGLLLAFFARLSSEFFPWLGQSEIVETRNLSLSQSNSPPLEL